MKAFLCLFALLSALLSFAPMTMADDEPVVKINVYPETVNVGEALTLEVTVLVPTWFTAPPVFPGFELTNTITTLPPDSSYPVSERIRGDTWSGIRRHYQVYPLLAAAYEISGQALRVRWADPGQPPREARIPVPVIRYSSVVPAGAEDLSPYLAGSGFTLTRTISDSTNLQPGDAVTLQLEASLDGLPAMFIPPLWNQPEVAGARVYFAEPVVLDESPAVRRERVTLVFEQPGEYKIPGHQIPWWNSTTNSVEEVVLPELNLHVVGVTHPPVATTSRTTQLLGLAVILLVIGMAWIVARRTAKRETTPQVAAYQCVLSAIARRDDADIYRAVLTWLELTGYSSSRDAFAGTPDLLDAFNTLRDRLYTASSQEVDYKLLLRRVKQVKPAAAQTHERTSLPALNP